jgi:uncharacterized heparinase superfamily protein
MMGNEPLPGMIPSMALQTVYLSRRLEIHLLGNHLWANLKALIFVSTVLANPELENIGKRALRRFRRQMREQVLADGGHIERSPMYQAILLEDLLDLIQLDTIVPGVLPNDQLGYWRSTAGQMLGWLRTMCHPDGEISFFNDAAFGIASHPESLAAYADHLGVRAPTPLPSSLAHLQDTGYVRMSRGDAVAIIDVAPVGPDYLPGHAHADTLSFELSIGGQRVVVNGGTSTYERGEQRSRERSTAYHNTVEVDGQDSSEVWATFRVARRARPLAVSTRDDPMTGQLVVRAGHDGYLRLGGNVYHYRSITMGSQEFAIEDRLTGAWTRGMARYRLAPGLRLIRQGRECGMIRGGTEDIPEIRWRAQGCVVWKEHSMWHPEFGSAVEVEVMVVEMQCQMASVRFEWRDKGETNDLNAECAS